jgi:hypothetical protein
MLIQRLGKEFLKEKAAPAEEGMIKAIRSVVDLKGPRRGDSPPLEERFVYVPREAVVSLHKFFYFPDELPDISSVTQEVQEIMRHM